MTERLIQSPQPPSEPRFHRPIFQILGDREFLVGVPAPRHMAKVYETVSRFQKQGRRSVPELSKAFVTSYSKITRGESADLFVAARYTIVTPGNFTDDFSESEKRFFVLFAANDDMRSFFRQLGVLRLKEKYLPQSVSERDKRRLARYRDKAAMYRLLESRLSKLAEPKL